jgi:hypothetical protein
VTTAMSSHAGTAFVAQQQPWGSTDAVLGLVPANCCSLEPLVTARALPPHLCSIAGRPSAEWPLLAAGAVCCYSAS